MTKSMARQSCCAMGMNLSSIETRVEQDCITKYNNGKKERVFVKKFALLFCVDVAKKVAIYWVDASACLTNFAWCTGSQLDVKIYDWIFMQPNYKENQTCMVHVTNYGTFVTDNGLNDWECYALNEYLCEAPL
jgi:hypothetical protein